MAVHPLSVEGYRDYLLRNGKESAAKMYTSMLVGFTGWMQTVKRRPFSSFTRNDVIEYKNTRETADTANAFLAAVKGYCGYRVGELSPDDPSFNAEMHRLTQLKGVARTRNVRKIVKTSLSPREVTLLLNQMHRDNVENVFFAGTVVQFYFGARPIDLAKHMVNARIDWKRNEMIIETSKIGDERYLAWHDRLTPYLKTWYNALPVPCPSEWLTKRLNRYRAGELTITAKVARKTVQTQMRLAGVEDFVTDAILGHVSTTSAIGDVYTDFTQVAPRIRDALVNRHYMIVNNII